MTTTCKIKATLTVEFGGDVHPDIHIHNVTRAVNHLFDEGMVSDEYGESWVESWNMEVGEVAE